MLFRLCTGLLALLISHSVFSQRAYHISPSGNDAHDGTRQHPWRSLHHAGLARLQPGDSVLLERNGVFRQMLVIAASGTAALPIYIGAYGSGDAPVISGAEQAAPAAWTRDTVNGTEVFKTPFSADAPFFYISGSRYYPARIPDGNNYFYITQLTFGSAAQVCPGVTASTFFQDGVFISDTLAVLPFQDFAGSWISLRTEGWEVTTRKIAAYQAGVVTLDQPSYAWNSSLQFKQGFGFILSGKKNYLSVPYEFYFDSVAQQLFVVTPGNMPPPVFDYSAYDYGIRIDAPGGHYILIDGIVLEKQKVAGVSLPRYGHHITIKNCVFRHHPFGIHALLQLDADCQVRKKPVDSVFVLNNIFTDMMRGAVDLNLAHSVVAGNVIRRVGLMINAAEQLNQYQSPYEYSISGGGTAIHTGTGTIAERNLIDSCGHYGIVPGDSGIARHNIVRNTCLNYKDCGAIYVVYHSPATVERNIIDGVKNDDRGTPASCDCGNGIYLDFNGDLTHRPISVSGNTVMNAATGIAILTTSNSAIGNNSISPPMTIVDNNIYASRDRSLSIGTIAARVGAPAHVAPLLFMRNTLAQFTQQSGLMWWSERFSWRTDYGISERNHYIVPFYALNFNRYFDHDNNPLTALRLDYRDFSDWQSAGNDTAGSFYFPYYDNYKAVNYSARGNLVRNALFDSNTQHWSSYFYGGILCINNNPLSVDHNSPLGGSSLKYQNPFAGGCSNIQASVSTALYDSSAASASVYLDTAKYYELSFDIASSTAKTISVYVQHTQAVHVFTKLLQSKPQPQRFTFYFKPWQPAATGSLLFHIPDAPNGFSLWLDNLTLREADVCEIPVMQMFPIFVNETADTQIMTFAEPLRDVNDDTEVTSIALAPFSSEIFTLTGRAKASIHPADAMTLCYGEAVQLQAAAHPAYRYRWLRDGVELPGETQPQLLAGESGDYQLIVERSDCFSGNADTSAITRVTILPEFEIAIVPDSTVAGDTLFASRSGLHYTWLLNGIPLSGADSSFLIAADTGVYMLIAKDDAGCSGTATALVTAPFVTRTVETRLSGFEIFPNPNAGEFFIRCTPENFAILELTDTKGKLLRAQAAAPAAAPARVECADLAPGIYYVFLKSSSGSAVRKVCVIR